MAIISDATKIDKSFKFTNGKGYTTTQKGVDNEDAPSGFIIGTSSIFSQDAGITSTAPGASTSILTYYGDGSSVARFKMIYDVSSPLNKAWYASTDGTNLTTMRNTRTPNWVPPTFGNYTIRIFLTSSGATMGSYLQEIFFSDATSPLFDYKTGILTFESDPLAAYASIAGGPPTGIQISGYVYTGPLLSQVFDGNGNFTGGLSDFGTSTSLAKFVNPNKTFEVSSPFAIGSSWVTETTPYGVSGVNWAAFGQFPDGKVIAMGITTVPSSAIIGVYSFGHGAWKKTGSLAGIFITTPYAIWCAPDNLTAYAIDSSGKVARTQDAGLNWSLLATLGFTTGGIWGSSLTDIYIVGNGGNIVHSTNGSTFSAQTNADTHNLYGIYGSSSGDVYAVGQAGTVLHSTGIGTWTVQTSGVSIDLFAVFALSSTEIYAGGAVGGPGSLIKSTGTGTWALFSTGIPSTMEIDGIWGISSGNTRALYVTGTSYGFTYNVCTSNGTLPWTLQQTFSFTNPGQAFTSAGGLSGLFGGLDAGRIVGLHKFAVETVHGHTTIDGYLSVNSSFFGQNADFTTLNLVNTPQSSPAITVSAPSSTNFVALTATSVDDGEGFRISRESTHTYTLDIGSKVTNNFDGTTPVAAGGRIRLGGFTTSPSTTTRGEIETVTSSALRINAYQNDLLIQNLFGVSGSTKGDVKLSTQNGAITLTAVGSENPSPAGQIILNPGTSTIVNLSTNTTSTKLQVLSPGGNFNTMFGNGTFQNNGSVTSPSGLFSSSVTTPTVQSSGNLDLVAGSTSITMFNSSGMNFNLPAGSNTYVLWPNSATVSTFRSQGHSGAYNIWDSEGNYLNSGNITSNGALQVAAGLTGSLKVQAAVASTGTYHYGMWVTVAGLFSACHVAGWGLGMNPCPANTYFDVQCSVSARLTGIAAALIYTDHDALPGKRDQDAYLPSSAFWSEFMVMLEFHIANTSGTGFTYGGRAAIY